MMPGALPPTVVGPLVAPAMELRPGALEIHAALARGAGGAPARARSTPPERGERRLRDRSESQGRRRSRSRSGAGSTPSSPSSPGWAAREAWTEAEHLAEAARAPGQQRLRFHGPQAGDTATVGVGAGPAAGSPASG